MAAQTFYHNILRTKLRPLGIWKDIYVFCRLRGPYSETVTEVLKMLPEAAGRGQHFQARWPEARWSEG